MAVPYAWPRGIGILQGCFPMIYRAPLAPSDGSTWQGLQCNEECGKYTLPPPNIYNSVAHGYSLGLYWHFESLAVHRVATLGVRANSGISVGKLPPWGALPPKESLHWSSKEITHPNATATQG